MNLQKFLLVLFCGLCSFYASAQTPLPHEAKSVTINNDALSAKVYPNTFQAKSAMKKAAKIKAWYNYNDALSSWYVNIIDFAPFMAPDTFMRYRSWNNGQPTTWERAPWNSVGCGFDPSDPLYDIDSDVLTEAFSRTVPYKIDSLSIPYLYYVTRPNEVDTLVLQLWAGNGTKGSGAESWSYTSGFETIKFTTVEFDITAGVGKGATKTIKYPLTIADTASETFSSLQIEIPGGLSVGSNNLVAATMTFIPGYNYKNGDTLASPFSMNPAYHNSFRFLMTSDEGSNNIGTYNNGLVVQYEQRHDPKWLQKTDETSRYLSGTLFNSYMYPNIYFHVLADIVTEVAEIPQQAFNLTAYPNPANETIRLGFELSEPGMVNTSVTDIAGKKMYATSDRMASGRQNSVIDISDFKPGIYFATMDAGNNVARVKFIIAR